MPGRDRTGRGWTPPGAGEYPLSESETRSLVIFLLEHPNIGVVNSMDTSVPMHLRGPSTSKSEERMYPEDLKLFRYFDEKGREISGYEWAGDTYFDYRNTRGRESPGIPLFGHGPDFGYWYYGSIWNGDELWNGGRVGDLNGNGEEDEEIDKLIYNETELTKSRFQDWTAVPHPEYGEVEVGGWNQKFWLKNGPPELLEIWAEKEARFNLMLASHMPQVIVHEPEIKQHKENEYTIEVEVENKGFLPTALQQAQLVKIVRPDMIYLDFPDELLAEASETSDSNTGTGNLDGDSNGKDTGAKFEMIEPDEPFIDIDRLKSGEKRKVKFREKLKEITHTSATIRYSSTRGGVKRKEIVLGEPE